MCGSMVDIQSPTAESRRGKKERRKKPQGKNIMACSIPQGSHNYLHTTITVLQPFVRDHPGEPVPEENLWTLWCKGRLTEVDTHNSHIMGECRPYCQKYLIWFIADILWIRLYSTVILQTMQHGPVILIHRWTNWTPLCFFWVANLHSSSQHLV